MTKTCTLVLSGMLFLLPALEASSTARHIPEVIPVVRAATAEAAEVETEVLPKPGTEEAKAFPALLDRPESAFVRKWYAAGTAAGNHGDYYDNRDGGHSMFRLDVFPQFSKVEYTPEEIRSRQHWGNAARVMPHVTIGNSSTSAPAASGGSNPRARYVTRHGMNFLYLQYRGNNLYVYPEHQDHDPGLNGRPGHGDLFPTNSPYVIISQGSSGSDRPFLLAWAHALTALRPEVKNYLIEQRLLMPTLQMLFRSTSKLVAQPSDYLTGRAHPTAFDGSVIDAVKMVTVAQALTLDKLVPMIQLKMVEESAAIPGVDFTEFNRPEQLSDTPAMIARVHRLRARDMRFVVSAEESFDPNGEPVTIHWAILRGKPELIQITPSEDGKTAEITISYHERFPVGHGSQLDSNRVDIGVFASNGTYYSAPGFFTVFYPDNEQRQYDAEGNLLEINYSAVDTSIGYPTRDIFTFGDRSPYEVSDYEKLLSMIAVDGEPGPLTSKLLHEQLNERERAFLVEMLSNFTEMKNELLPEWQKISRNTEMPAAERSTLLNEIDRKIAALLLRADAELKLSVKDIFDRVLEETKSNLRLYVDNATAIDALAEQAPDATRVMFEDTRDLLIGWGLLARDAEGRYDLGPGLAPHPMRQDTSPFERSLLESFNMMLMRELLYPGAVNVSPRENYVDHRLVNRAHWCDVYLYTQEGTPEGWLRFQGAERYVFTQQGHMVIGWDREAGIMTAAGVENLYDAIYNHPQTRRSIGKMIQTMRGVEVFDSANNLLVGLEDGGAGAHRRQVRFLIPEDQQEGGPALLVDILHLGADGSLEGRTRYGGEEPVNFGRNAADNIKAVFVNSPSGMRFGYRVTDERYRYNIGGNVE